MFTYAPLAVSGIIFSVSHGLLKIVFSRIAAEVGAALLNACEACPTLPTQASGSWKLRGADQIVTK